MLYFTFKSGKTDGIFSGRFAFKRHRMDDGDAEKVLEGVEKSAFLDAGQIPEHLGEVIFHERAHHAIAARSKLNLYLVGLRFLARVQFAFGLLDRVRSYYERRTVYFALAYKSHEAFAEDITRGKLSSPSASHVAQVKRLDICIEKIAKRIGSAYRPGFWFLWCIGFLATREFGTVLAVTENGTTKLKEAAVRGGFSGIFNSAFQPSAGDGKLVRVLKFVNRSLNIERIASYFGGRLGENEFFAWTCCKFLAEYQAIVDLFYILKMPEIDEREGRLLSDAFGEYQSPDDYFQTYLMASIPFALAFQGEDITKIPFDLGEVISELVAGVKADNLDWLSPRSRELLTKAGGLFFYHGN